MQDIEINLNVILPQQSLVKRAGIIGGINIMKRLNVNPHRAGRMIGALRRLALPILLVLGCEGPASGGGTPAELRAALESLLSADNGLSLVGLPDVDGIDGENLGGFGEVRIHGSSADTLWPGDYDGIRWGRRITSRSRDVTFDDLGSDTAYATIVWTTSGRLWAGGWVRTDSGRSLVDTLSKTFEAVAARRVRFLRVGDSGDPHRDWRIHGFTAMLGSAGTKVSIERVVFALGETDHTILDLTRSDILSHFFMRDSLPALTPRVRTALFVSVGNTGPELPVDSGELVVVWPGRHRQLLGHQAVNDLGEGLDNQAGDNVFSGFLRAHGRGRQRGRGHIIIECIDLGSILVGTEETHLEFIGFPHRMTGGRAPRGTRER